MPEIYLSNNSFMTVMSNQSLEHIKNIERVLRGCTSFKEGRQVYLVPQYI
jgi:hypothetical protein